MILWDPRIACKMSSKETYYTVISELFN